MRRITGWAGDHQGEFSEEKHQETAVPGRFGYQEFAGPTVRRWGPQRWGPQRWVPQRWVPQRWVLQRWVLQRWVLQRWVLQRWVLQRWVLQRWAPFEGSESPQMKERLIEAGDGSCRSTGAVVR